MTNFEFWKNEILRICREYESIPAIVKGRPIPCSDVKCDNCDIYAACEINIIEWLYDEHVEYPKLTKRERAFCEALKTGWMNCFSLQKSRNISTKVFALMRAFTAGFTVLKMILNLSNGKTRSHGRSKT